MSLMWNFICIFARKNFNYMPMDNRNTVQLNSFVGCLGNSSATGLKNQMKESKASERKTTQQSLFFHLLFLCALLMITIIRKTKCYRFTKRNVPKRKTKRLRYRCPPEPYSNSVRTDFFSYSNAIILENQQINTSI